MKLISVLALTMFSACAVHAQVKYSGSAVNAAMQNGNMMTTKITVPSSTFSSNLIAVSITEIKQSSVLSVMDMESAKAFTLAQSAKTSNGTRVALYYLVGAGSGSHTIRIATATGNKTSLKVVTTTYTGVDMTSPIAYASVNTNTATDNQPAVNIHCYQDQMVVGAMAFEPAMTAPASDIMAAALPTNVVETENDYAESTSGNVNLSWKYTGGYWAALAITLKPTVYAFIPGQLTSFTGKLNSNRVELSWTTTFENNVKDIVILRSEDNKNWKEVISLEGSGNSSIQKQYAATDRTIETGNYFYKLVYISEEGKKLCSSTVSVKVTADKKLSFGTMPNPFFNDLQVVLFTPSDKNVTITLLNARGVVLASKNVKPENGFLRYTINQTASIAPGIYFLQCSGENEMISTTIVKK